VGNRQKQKPEAAGLQGLRANGKGQRANGKILNKKIVV
jgi:hypothetical protein